MASICIRMSFEEIRAITDSLLGYCELDTLAMVMIHEHLREIFIYDFKLE